MPVSGTSVRRSKHFALTLAGSAVLALALSSCGSSGTAGDTSASASGGDAVAGAKVSIVAPLSGDPYYTQVACGAQAAGKKLGMDVGELQAPTTLDQAAVSNTMQSVLAAQPKALIYTPADPVAGGLPITNAKQDGVTVIDVDAQLQDENLYDSFVASDHKAGAEAVAKYLADSIGGSGQIAAIGSLASNPITQARIAGFEEAMKAYPNIQVVSIEYPDTQADAIQANAAATLVKYPDLKGFYTTNYLNSTGAAVALKNAGKVGTVKMVSWDAGSANIQLLQEGSLQATVAQQPYKMGELAIEQIAKKLKGESVEKTVNAPTTILTSDMVDTDEGKALAYKSTCS